MLNHVLLHQTVIGQEAIEQMAMAGEEPDVVIGCAGGGSNFAGLTFPFIGRGLRGGPKPRVIAVEPEAAPSLTKGEYRYDFGDMGQMAPLVKMHTLGHTFIPEPIHAGGLRYHGMSPLVSLLKETRADRGPGRPPERRRSRPVSSSPGPRGSSRRPSRRTRSGSPSTRRSRPARRGAPKVILFNLCGHGHFDLSAYERYLTGTLEDFDYPAERVADALKELDLLPV